MPRTRAVRSRITRTHVAVVAVTVALVVSGVALGSGSAGGQTTISGLEVTGAERTLGPNEAVSDVTVSVQADWQYDSTHAPDDAVLELYAAESGGSLTQVDAVTLSDPALNDSGTTTLSGGLVSSGAVPSGTFDVQSGGSTTETVDVKAVLKLRRNGERIGVADSSTQADVSVSKEELTVSASISGDGALSVVVE